MESTFSEKRNANFVLFADGGPSFFVSFLFFMVAYNPLEYLNFEITPFNECIPQTFLSKKKDFYARQTHFVSVPLPYFSINCSFCEFQFNFELIKFNFHTSPLFSTGCHSKTPHNNS